MTHVIASRWKYSLKIFRITFFLRRLDVPFRDQGDFWSDNKEQLREIYEAMQDAARERMQELHPDRGGDGHEFGVFISHLRAAQRWFRRYLKLDQPLPATVKFTPIEQVRRNKKAAWARARRRKNRKAFRAYMRAYYHKRRAAGWRDNGAKERQKKYLKRHRLKLRRRWKRWRENNREQVLKRKRASYHRTKATRPKRDWRSKEGTKRHTPGTPEYEHRLKWRRARDAKLRAKRLQADGLPPTIAPEAT